MLNCNLKFKISISVFCIFYFLFSAFYLVGAQTSQQFLVSWKSYSYTPSWYQGKIFPTKGSRLEVSFELIDAGKIADISKSKVRWYVNDKLVKNENNGLGIKSLVFNVGDYPGQETEIRITIVDYKGAGAQLDKIIKIPIAAPEAVIDAPYKDIGVGETYFTAYPFFFNIKDLTDFNFEWQVNGVFAEQNDETPRRILRLNLDQKTPPGFTVEIKSIVRNILEEMESASKIVRYSVR